MRTLLRTLGGFALGLAVLALIVGIASWPPGGLMFAAPYVFFFAGFILALSGCVLLLLGRRVRKDRREVPDR